MRQWSSPGAHGGNFGTPLAFMNLCLVGLQSIVFCWEFWNETKQWNIMLVHLLKKLGPHTFQVWWKLNMGRKRQQNGLNFFLYISTIKQGRRNVLNTCRARICNCHTNTKGRFIRAMLTENCLGSSVLSSWRLGLNALVKRIVLALHFYSVTQLDGGHLQGWDVCPIRASFHSHISHPRKERRRMIGKTQWP